VNAMASSYQKLSLADKRALDLSRVREPSLPCPRGCGMSLMAVDLLAHLKERCSGPPDPGPTAKWVSARDAIVRGVPKGTLSYWVERGFVRARGPRMDREYLLRDLALRIGQRNGFRRR